MENSDVFAGWDEAIDTPVVEETKAEAPAKEESPKEEVNTDDLFSEFIPEEETPEEPVAETATEEEPEEEPETPEEPAASEPTVFEKLNQDLVQKGILPAGENEEIKDATSFYAKWEDALQKGSEDIINSWRDQLGAEEFEIIKYISNGGKIADIPLQRPEKVDLSNEKGQEAFLKKYLKEVEELDDDDIEIQLDVYRESDKIEHFAKKYHKKIESAREAELESKLKMAEQVKLEQQAKAKQQRDRLVKEMQGVDKVGDWEINADEKDDLIFYALSPVKNSEGRMETGLMTKLREVLQDPSKLTLLAKMLKTDFDAKPLITKGKKQATNEFRSAFDESTKRVKSSAKRAEVPTQAVWEFFK